MQKLLLHFWTAFFLIVCLVEMGIGQTLSNADSIIFEDPGGKYTWSLSSQEVAGADVDMLALRVYINKGAGQSATDTTWVYFFIPGEESPVIELHQGNFLSTLKPVGDGWPAGFFQCVKLPNSIAERIILSPQEVLAFGKIQQNPELYFPVAINANRADSVNLYKFKFKPNMDIEIKYSIYRQSAPGNWEPVIPEKNLEFYPGHLIFAIRWDGRLQGRLAAEGIYKLVIRGKKFYGGREIDMVREYIFYHKPVYEQCRKKQ